MKKIIAGVDEVGRGSLIGPVYAAAVILNNNIEIKKLTDSKKLTKIKRENLDISIKEIEKYNILKASLLAMRRAIKKLKKKPTLVLIDGNKTPILKGYKLKFIIKGDQKIPEISAASIIAKVARDKLIKKISKKYKGYFWDQNAGYGTNKHLKAIRKLGITKFHRKKFKPVYNMLRVVKSHTQIKYK